MSRKRNKSGSAPKHQEIHVKELKSILERARSGPLEDQDIDTLSVALDTLAYITQELEQAGATIARLRKLVFGAGSEKTADVVAGDGDDADRGAEVSDIKRLLEASSSSKGKRKGHGRNGAKRYVGAEQVAIAHDTLEHGEPCPQCERGKVYRQPPSRLVRVKGMAPLAATVYALERLRCNLCGEVFTAKAPAGVGSQKYDDSAAAMMALLKYGCGLPFNRIARLGKNLGMPMPVATQWQVVAQAANAFEPLWAELVEQAAGGQVVHIDDTYARVLVLNEAIKKELLRGESKRTGIFTSGVVASVDDQQLVLFFTGRDHAGENLAKVLKLRASGLSPPIQMGDATSRNTSPGAFETIVANCMAHSRRHFVDVVDNFPDEVRHVLETLRDVYRHDAHARNMGMPPEERLRYHQTHSLPLMDALDAWFTAQFDQRKVEPNSSLGDAIRYMQNHWDELTCLPSVCPGHHSTTTSASAP